MIPVIFVNFLLLRRHMANVCFHSMEEPLQAEQLEQSVIRE